MGDTMENFRLGRKVVNLTDKHPELLDMRIYAREAPCGTVGCLAGHAMLLSGYELRGRDFCRPDGSVVESETSEAAMLLGLDGDVAWEVFHAFSTGPEQFRKLVEEAEAAARE